MIHCRTLLEATLAASTACLAWEDRKTGETWTMKKLAAAEQPVLDDDAFYVVSREGAIGLAKGAEYRTTWLLLPHDEATQQEILASMKQDFINESDRIDSSPLAAEAAELAKKAEAQAAKPAAPSPAPQTPAPKSEEKVPELTLEPELSPAVFESILPPELIFDEAMPSEKPTAEPDTAPIVLNIPTYRTAKQMAAAAKMAAEVCSGWHLPDNPNQGYDAMMLQYLCGKQDASRPLAADSGSYYLVSPEGAIGLTEDDSAHISWLYLPMTLGAATPPDSIPAAPTMEVAQPPVAPEPPAPFGKPEAEPETPKQRYCPKCGKPVSAKGKFCMNCGNRLDKPTPAKPICPNCGAELNIGSKFCMKCGTRVSE